MKGLLIKDFNFLKNQKQFYVTVMGLVFIFSYMGMNASFVVCYLTIMLSIFVLSTISYDTFENGEAYLFTLPVSRKGYVREKYIFAVILITAAALISVLPALFILMVGNNGETIGSVMASLAGGVVAAVLLLSLSIPFQLKYEANKSRIATFVLTMLIVVVGMLAYRACDGAGIDLVALADDILRFHPGAAAAVAIAVPVASACVSYAVSVRIMEKKEF